MAVYTAVHSLREHYVAHVAHSRDRLSQLHSSQLRLEKKIDDLTHLHTQILDLHIAPSTFVESSQPTDGQILVDPADAWEEYWWNSLSPQELADLEATAKSKLVTPQIQNNKIPNFISMKIHYYNKP